jgi:hypothetical protein
MHCLRLKTDTGWIAIEMIKAMLEDHPEIFSHGMCPVCREKHYPEIPND